MRHGATSAAAAGTGAAEIATALSESRRLFVAIGVFSAFVNVLMLTGPLFMLQVYDRVLTGALMRGAGRAGLRGGRAALPPDGLWRSVRGPRAARLPGLRRAQAIRRLTPG